MTYIIIAVIAIITLYVIFRFIEFIIINNFGDAGYSEDRKDDNGGKRKKKRIQDIEPTACDIPISRSSVVCDDSKLNIKREGRQNYLENGNTKGESSVGGVNGEVEVNIIDNVTGVISDSISDISDVVSSVFDGI